ncbi:C-type lectin domain family 4 member M isoform X1 [Lates calcarifer]|uniref:C-type lectin domain family 4 member M isoform X1 n=1 Tax=Lates calcarifer TaxID=8187 RepID=A0AAJ7LEU9_LATCA|nr:C-type lectin domain family 4 member M isoform X1 [Lates calcarifer]
MARVLHKEQSEIHVDYVNAPNQLARGSPSKNHTGKDSAVISAVSGRKLYRLVGVSFGLLCILQIALNISLRLTLSLSDRPDNKTSGVEVNCKILADSDHYFKQGWVYFRPSFYYISSIKKSWQDSRDDCLRRGADLVIINSREEQDFTRKFHRISWIGLTLRETKGEWKWVDGTPLTKSYWGSGEPNDYEGKTEDCVEIKFHDEENSWNDIPCGDQNFWICEKTVAL